MRKVAVLLVAVLLFLPVSQAFAQKTDTGSALAVKLTATQPFVYKNQEGYTVIIGEVENTRNFPVNNVKIAVGFYGSSAGGPGGVPAIETAVGTSLLEVIPPFSKSPFVVLSNTPDPRIAEVNMNIIGFNSAAPKPQLLEISTTSAIIGDTVRVSADVTNKGQQDSDEVTVHLIAYDAFVPPRIIGIESISVDNVARGATESIMIETRVDYRASSFKMIAESYNYQSKMTAVTDLTLESLAKLITIRDVRMAIFDEEISETNVGVPMNITSNLAIQFAAHTNAKQEYVYYAQVKQFGEMPVVEFLGSTEGVFESGEPQNAVVEWIPQNEGIFFVEAYVWDKNGVALASQSKTISIILVKP
jgi:hypothetical protein